MDGALHLKATWFTPNSCLCMEQTPDIDDDQFPVMDLKVFYSNVAEPIPPNVPKPLGKPVHIHMFVDNNHVGDKQTRHSQIGGKLIKFNIFSFFSVDLCLGV